jgi:tetratricopeptide (TPR) repeat protein
MYNIIFLIIILICSFILGYLFFTKIHSLANLDVNNLPEEIEQQKKKEIVIKRLENKGREFGRKIISQMSFLNGFWFFWQKRFRSLVNQIEKLWHHEESIKKKTKELSSKEKEEKSRELLKTAQSFFAGGNYEKAEELYIGALRLDPKSEIIYRGLADTYLAKKSYNEAVETYEFLLSLNKNDDNVLIKLGEIKEIQNKLDDAIGYFQRAAIIGDSSAPRFFHLAELLLKVGQPEVAKEAIMEACALEPRNPKYLDLLIETAIICHDKSLAEKTFQELRLVNPENHKLTDFKERIARL